MCVLTLYACDNDGASAKNDETTQEDSTKCDSNDCNEGSDNGVEKPSENDEEKISSSSSVQPSDDRADSSSSEEPASSESDDEGKVDDVSSSSTDSGSFLGVMGTLTDSRDGKNYKTVTIGTQTWMAENLNYDNKEVYSWYRAMGIEESPASSASSSAGGCGDGVTSASKDTARSVCPEGWHVPNDAEWETLFTAVGGKTIAGKMLKSASGWENGANGTDSYGFAVLPKNDDGSYASFWSSSEDLICESVSKQWGFSDDEVRQQPAHKYEDHSVRCLQD